jgi:hypothetical protein
LAGKSAFFTIGSRVSLTPETDTRQPVTVGPGVAPKTTPKACGMRSTPAPTNPITITVVALDARITAVALTLLHCPAPWRDHEPRQNHAQLAAGGAAQSDAHHVHFLNEHANANEKRQ